jgi:hypothetical protein
MPPPSAPSKHAKLTVGAIKFVMLPRIGQVVYQMKFGASFSQLCNKLRTIWFAPVVPKPIV